jgi:hypothetical protein
VLWPISKINSHHLPESTEESVIGMDFEFDNSLQLCRLTQTHVILIKPFYTFSSFRKKFFICLFDDDDDVINSDCIVLNDWMIIVSGLIDDAVNILDCIAFNGVIGEYNEWERIWKEAVMV